MREIYNAVWGKCKKELCSRIKAERGGVSMGKSGAESEVDPSVEKGKRAKRVEQKDKGFVWGKV